MCAGAGRLVGVGPGRIGIDTAKRAARGPQGAQGGPEIPGIAECDDGGAALALLDGVGFAGVPRET
jgi:hypothetical protein